MAIVRIRNWWRDEQAIPNLCIRCGQPTTYRKTKEFVWYPHWIAVLLRVGVLPWLIVALLRTKRRTLDVPLCERHRHHFLRPPLIIVSGFLLVFVLLITLVVMASQFSPDYDVTGLVCIGALVGLLVWVFMALLSQSQTVRPKEITDDEIVLVGVAPEFVEEIENQLEASRASPLDREVREHWSRGGSGRGRDEEERTRDRSRREDDEDEDDRDRYSRRP
jgi:hypothetical protein